MNIFVTMKNYVHLSRIQLNVLNIYACSRCTFVMMDNVLTGILEWHFNDSDQCNLNYTFKAIPHQSAWTLNNGLCCPDRDYNDPRYSPWNLIDSLKLTNDEKYQYLFLCILSDGFERDCLCNRENHRALMIDSNVLIFYN